jgi:hypothetical protein
MSRSKINTVFLAVIAVVFCFSTASAEDITAKKTPAAQTKSFIAAYYFHGNFRCPTCRKMEQYSRESIELNFAQQLKSGALVFQPINIDEPENQHFVQDYQLVTRSLVLVKYENSKQTAWKNLPAIWQKVGDEKAFFDYVKSEIAAYL